VITASPFRGTHIHDAFAVNARQPAVRDRTAAKFRDKDLLTTPRLHEAPNSSRPVARHFMEPEKPKAPVSGS
jgi:hypothetical protein